jgi:tripartite-type tricarboxylate transporter receptor subunit TctC
MAAKGGSTMNKAGIWLGVTALLGLTCGAAAQPSADAYPSQTVRIVVPFSAGSITDGLARVLADELGKAWKQSVIVENRPGIAGTATVAKSAPDGYTLMLTSNGHTIASVVNKSLPYDPAKDFAGVAPVATVPQALIIPPDLSAKTLTEWLALARAKPGEMNFSSAGLASTSYLGAELLKQTAKINIVHIPQRGAPEAVTSVMRGDSQLFFLGVNIATELHNSGKIRAMAVSTAKRSAALPDVPTVAEAGLPEYKYDAWFAVMAPAATPQSIINKVNQEIGRVLRIPEIADRLTRQGVDIDFGPAGAFDAQFKSEVERNSAMLRAAGVGGN